MGCTASQSLQAPARVTSEEKVVRDFFDKYCLGEKLGRGAFAQVRACTKISSKPSRAESDEAAPRSEKAVKILDVRMKDNPDAEDTSLHNVAQKEVSLWQAIGNNSNCIRLCDVFVGDGLYFMVMERCSSGLLQALEAMPEINECMIGNVCMQMLSGIAHCHSVRVVHRDVKPDNFLVGGADGRTVKLGDFGLSARMPKQGKLSGVYGTAPFMCPEMLNNKGHDEKADVWALAVIVYVFLYGRFPYMPKQQSSKAMKQAIIDGAAPSFEPVQLKSSSSVSQKRSPDAVSFARFLLNRDPEKRPSAEQALNMPWMRDITQGQHMRAADLPSLRPMLHQAKKVGAFEVRDPSNYSPVDKLLNSLHEARCGEPLPTTLSPEDKLSATLKKHQDQMTRQTSPSRSDQRLKVAPREGKSKKIDGIGDDWELASNVSNRTSSSTTCGSSASSRGIARSQPWRTTETTMD
jgi:serine/threonine protein kinase